MDFWDIWSIQQGPLSHQISRISVRAWVWRRGSSEPIKAVFGWDEQVQLEIYTPKSGKKKGLPEIIELRGKSHWQCVAASITSKWKHFYFCRFFLPPEYHGKGIGSQVLTDCLTQPSKLNKPVELCYLQGKSVLGSYISDLPLKSPRKTISLCICGATDTHSKWSHRVFNLDRAPDTHLT